MNSYSEMSLSDLEFMYDQTNTRFVDTFLNEVYSEFMRDFMTYHGVEEEVMDTRIQYDPEKELMPERAGMAHADLPENHEEENFILVGPSADIERGFEERLITAGLGEEYLHEHFDFTDILDGNQAEEVEESIGRIWQLYCHDRLEDQEFREDYLRGHQRFWNRQNEQGSGDRIRDLSEFLLGEFDNRSISQDKVMKRIISKPHPLTQIYLKKF